MELGVGSLPMTGYCSSDHLASEDPKHCKHPFQNSLHLQSVSNAGKGAHSKPQKLLRFSSGEEGLGL